MPWRHLLALVATLSLSGITGARAQAPGDTARIDSMLDTGFAGSTAGRYSEMLSLGEEALRLSTALGDQYRVARSHLLIGSGYYNQTRLPAALEALERGERIAIEIDAIPLRKIASQMLGNTLRTLGRFAEALAKFEEWRRQNQRLPAPEPEGRMARAIGIVYFEMGDIDRAEIMVREALAHIRRSGDVQFEAPTLFSLSVVSKRRGQHREAITQANEALERARAVKALPLQAEILNAIGDSYRSLGDLDQAASNLREARDIAAPLKYYGLLAQVTERLGQIEALRSRHAEAIVAFREANDSYLALGDPPEKRYTVELSWAQSARALGDRAAALMHYREAIALVERLETNTVPQELERAIAISARRALFEEAAGAVLEYEGAAAALELADRSRARAFLHTLGDVEKTAPMPVLATRDRIQRELAAPGRVFVEYLLGEKQSLVWVVSQNEIRTAVLPARSEIEKLALAERNGLGEIVTALTMSRSRRDADARERALYRMLIAPIEPFIAGSTHLVIVPDGALAYVPFEALKPTDTSYLIERVRVSYAQSAASSLALRDRAGRTAAATNSIAAFGNPDYSSARPGTAALAPLPHSADEVGSVSRGFANRSVFVGARATEAAAKRTDLAQFRYLHFAVHGFTDAVDPSQSGLALTVEGNDDGVLRMDEIARLKMNADLVTLSACRTATGRFLTGEGLLSLGRAFFYAGARQVVASLWDVNDASTSALMSAFYRHIDAGQPVADALREAKLSLLRGGRATWAHPHHWSPFIALQ